jgi:hypothetical protein
MAFWRRNRGRHAFGAAVTGVPSAPAYVPPPAPAAAYAPAVPVPAAAPVSYAPAPVPEQPVGPRAQLTFADGTSASLDPDQARALDEIAQLMTGRDGVKHQP